VDFNGKGWPYEAIQQQRQMQTQANSVYVVLMGEADDCTALRALTTQLSYLQKFGRPFSKFYRSYYVSRPVYHKAQQGISKFAHDSFTISGVRKAQLVNLLSYCPTMLYEISECVDGQLVTTRNYNEYNQDNFLEVVEAALQERGWKKGEDPGPFLSIEDWQEAKKGNAPLGYHEPHRWWTTLCKVWKKNS
jgi:hypothetical protein